MNDRERQARDALRAAYRFISQPSRSTENQTTYDLAPGAYNRLTQQIRDALRALEMGESPTAAMVADLATERARRQLAGLIDKQPNLPPSFKAGVRESLETE